MRGIHIRNRKAYLYYSHGAIRAAEKQIKEFKDERKRYNESVEGQFRTGSVGAVATRRVFFFLKKKTKTVFGEAQSELLFMF